MSISSVVLEGFRGSASSVVLCGFGAAGVVENLPHVAPVNRVLLFETLATKTLVAGDTFREICTLFAGEQGDAYDVSGAVSIKACVVSHDHTQQLTDAVVLTRTMRGADWDNGRVAVTLPKANTALITSKRPIFAKLELQVSFPEEDYTWFVVIKVVPGRLS